MKAGDNPTAEATTVLYSMPDESMEPLIPREAIVFFDTASVVPRNGQIVVALRGVEQQPLVRQFSVEGARWWLRSPNPRYDAIPVDSSVRIVGLGRMLEIRLP